MKKKLSWLLELVIGIIFVVTGYFIVEAEYYAALFYAVGFGLVLVSCMKLSQIWYYGMPRNRARFENRSKESHINSVDERKIFLRMKAGSLVYQLMTFVYLAVAFVLALLHVEVWIMALIFSLFLLQTVLGLILYRHFEKNF